MKEFMNNPAFQKMNPKKQQMIELLVDTLNHKKITEALPVLMEWKKQMDQEGLAFTEEENQLLTEIFSAQMTPAQKKQYEFLKPFIKN
ncbi:MAG: hypothetical protein SO170_03660 [Butyribacter sp.]|nr:hypothetical protein [bacterium]MDY3854050.1 hypothetical protein [Butyribacter sp.]